MPSFPVLDGHEPLVDLLTIPSLRLHPASAASGRPQLLRLGVVDRLITAQTLLPPSMRLLLTLAHHRATGGAASFALRRHSAGGAVDVTLYQVDRPEPAVPPQTLAASCLFQPSCLMGAVPVPDQEWLFPALEAVGMIADRERRWHWSYGDRDWALATGAASARYGPAG